MMRRDDDEFFPVPLEGDPSMGPAPLLPPSSGFSFIAPPGGSPSVTPSTPVSPPSAGAVGVGGFLNSIFSLPGITDSTTTPEARGAEIQRDLGLKSLLSSNWLAKYDDASGTITISEKPSSMPFFGNKATIPLCRLDPRSQTVEIINPEKKAFQEAAKVAAAIAQRAQATGTPCELHIYDNTTPGTITQEGLVEIVKELRNKGITSFKVEQTLLNRVGGTPLPAELAGVPTYVAPRPATPLSSTATPLPPSTFPSPHSSPSTSSPPPPSSPTRGEIVEDLNDETPGNTF